MITYILQLLSAIGASTIISGVAMGLFNRWMKQKDAQATQQEQARKAKQEEQTEAEKERLMEQESIKDGMLALLHDRIFAIHADCEHKGYATPEEMRNLDYLYKPYHALGGNGTGTQLYDRVMNMPTESQKAAI